MVVPRGGGHGRGRGRGRGKLEPKAKAKAKAAKSKPSPKKPARASEGRALVKVKKEPGTAEAAASSVDTKGKLSNLVTQGKAAANKLAKVVAGEQTVNPEELEALKSKGGATDKRMEMLASWESDRSGRAWATKEKVFEKESASASSKVGGALSRLCLSFTFFFLGRGGGLID